MHLMQGNAKRISRTAQALIGRATTLLVSPVVTVEMEFLFELQRVKLQWREVEAKLGGEIGLQVCEQPFTRVCQFAIEESWTRDPFDRIIVAQAKANGLAPLISSDERIRQHYTRAVW